jgi:Protein kinase domain/TPR repeat
MGAVYLAVDLMLDREVALKALRPELAGRREIVDRFREEARVQARLNHPNIAQLYSLFQHDAGLFMVMEYVKGPTLDQVIRRGGITSFPEAVSVFLQVLDGVDHAHRMGIVHRDLKPANIMFDEDGLVKVTDFGIARVLGSARLTRQGAMIGTLEYMSPERVMSRELDSRSDLYSLGFVFYEMLAGAPPFVSEVEYEIMVAQIEQAPPRIEDKVPGVPREVGDAIFKTMAKNPDDRFATVAEFAAVLRKHAGVTRRFVFPGDSVVSPGATDATFGFYSAAPADRVAATRLADSPVFANSESWDADQAVPAPGSAPTRSRVGFYLAGGLGLAALMTLFLVSGLPRTNPSGASSATDRAIPMPEHAIPQMADRATSTDVRLPADDGSMTSPRPGVNSPVPQATSASSARAASSETANSPEPAPYREVIAPSSTLPVIAEFAADSPLVRTGEDVRLRWSISGDVRDVTLIPGGRVGVSASGFVVRPAGTTVYTLTAQGTSGATQRSVKVEVNPYIPPAIIDFSPGQRTVAPGQTTRLTWAVTGDITKIAISPGGPLSLGTSAIEITPQRTTDYTLEATGPSGTTSRTITIDVVKRTEPPPAVIQNPVVNNDGAAQQAFADAQSQLAARRFEQAAVLFGRAANLKPGWAEPLVEKAKLDSKLGRFPDAIEDCTRALAIRPNDTVALNLRGYAHYSLNQFPDAITDLDAAVRLNPDFADAYQNRGNTRWASGDKNGAQADFGRARSIRNGKAAR